MGVHDFFKIRQQGGRGHTETIADLGTEVTLKELSGTRICIDASLMIYNTILALEYRDALTSEDGRITAHIYIILNKILQMKACDITQIWIFDSPVANEMKTHALALREERRAKAAANSKSSYKLTPEHVGDIQKLLRLMGIMYITAPSGIEAEQYGAFLTQPPPASADSDINDEEPMAFCRYMLTGDSDVLAFGGNMLRISSVGSAASGGRHTTYTTFKLADILAALKVSKEQFVHACVLMGTDFNSKLEGVGPANVVTRVKKGDYILSPMQEMASDYFLSNVSTRATEAEVVQEPYNREGLIAWLTELDFDIDRIEHRLPQ